MGASKPPGVAPACAEFHDGPPGVGAAAAPGVGAEYGFGVRDELPWYGVRDPDAHGSEEPPEKPWLPGAGVFEPALHVDCCRVSKLCS